MNEKKYIQNHEYDILEQLIPMTENLKKCSREGMTGCIDWLSCTFDCFDYEIDNLFMRPIFDKNAVTKMKNLLAFFGKYNCDINMLTLENGSFGFKGRIELQEGINLLVCGPTCSNGVPSTTLNISGKGCNYLIKSDLKNFINLIKYLLEHAYKFTRCDLAIDNFTELFQLDKISNLIKEENYTSFSKVGFNLIGKPNKKSKYGYDGLTYYLGDKKTSDMQLRIYAKNFEQGVENEIDNWTRFEIQINDHTRIKQVLLLLIIGYETTSYFDFFNFISGFLYDIVQFKEPSNDTNKSRWKEDEDYLEFLNHVEKITLFASPSNKTNFDVTLDWFKRSCSLFLTQLYLIYGEEKFFKYINYLIVRKYDDLKTKDIDFINNARTYLGIPELTEIEMKREILKLNKKLSSNDFNAFEGGIKVVEGAVFKEEVKDDNDD